MSKTEKFAMGKSITHRPSEKEEVWTKKSLELTVKMPEQYTEIDFQAALDQAEYLIDTWLGTAKAAAPQVPKPQIPEFNPEELMKHEWKGKKTGEGQYAEGSTSWGWDFTDKFSKEIIEVLKKGPVTIDQNEFSLNKEQTLVSAKKKKESTR